MLSRTFASLGLSTLIAGLLVAITFAPAPAVAATSSNAASAVGYASSHGYSSAIGVYDTQAGTFIGAGNYNSTYASESVMKVFIATRLLMTGQMAGWNETTAYKMITQSDDASADALYGRTGGDAVITWVKQALNLPGLGSPPLRPGWWGGTQITAAGMAAFYNAVKHLPSVWNWLGNAMAHATTYGSDGTFQFFGIPSATTGAAVKQGWGGDDAAGLPAFNSTGLVNGNRYAVVILTQGGSYGTPIANILTAEARLLMPGGRIVDGSPVGGVSSWSLHGRYLTISGWALDPDSPPTPLRIFFYVNGKPFTYVDSTVSRPDIDAHFHTTGNHGFSKLLALADGTNNVCAYAINVGAGSNTALGCRTLALTGTPLGGVSTLGQQGRNATLTGWAFDYDAPSTPLLVRAYVNGGYAGGSYTSLPRPDINSTLHGTGMHGFSLTVGVPTGASTVCLYALNIGSGQTANLGCRGLRVSQSPIGNVNPVTVQGNQVRVSGFVLDFDDPARAAGVVIDLNGTHSRWGPTTVARADINSEFAVTGLHGFDYSIPLPAGITRICAYGVNFGPGGNVALGCQSVTIAAAQSGTPKPAAPKPAAPTGSATAPPTGPAPAQSSAPATAPGSSSRSASSPSSPAASAPAGP